MLDVLDQAVSRLRNGVPFCMVTVVETSGSVPGPSGARMLVLSDSIEGTVGGGALEKFAIEEARTLVAAGEGSRLVRRQTADLGMRCGGEVTLFFEPFGRLPRLWVFGGGHIAKELLPIAVSLNMRVTVADARPEFATAARFPGAASVICGEPATVAKDVEPGSYVVIVTHGHAHDQAVLETLLGIDPPLAYIGMIGSRSKVKRALAELKEAGLEPGTNLYAPVGLELGGGAPAEIAVAIAAEILALLKGSEDVVHCRDRMGDSG